MAKRVMAVRVKRAHREPGGRNIQDVERVKDERFVVVELLNNGNETAPIRHLGATPLQEAIDRAERRARKLGVRAQLRYAI